MAIDGVYMYISLILVFLHISKFTLTSMLAGWGAPLIVVVITLSIGVDNYELYNGQL